MGKINAVQVVQSKIARTLRQVDSVKEFLVD